MNALLFADPRVHAAVAQWHAQRAALGLTDERKDEQGSEIRAWLDTYERGFKAGRDAAVAEIVKLAERRIAQKKVAQAA